MKKEKNMTENIADKEMSECKLCPRNCKKNRKNKEKGYCLMTDELCVARAALAYVGRAMYFRRGRLRSCVFFRMYFKDVYFVRTEI